MTPEEPTPSDRTPESLFEEIKEKMRKRCASANRMEQEQLRKEVEALNAEYFRLTGKRIVF